MTAKAIAYPYLPEGRMIKYVPADNVFMALAKAFARAQSLDRVMPGAAVVVIEKNVIGIGANGSRFHDIYGCERVRLGCKSGQGYELCEGCHPKNHSEAKAIASAEAQGIGTENADLYLWGHWWCCQPCWDRMIAARIKDVYLMGDSKVLFNKEHPDNIVGRQFDT